MRKGLVFVLVAIAAIGLPLFADDLFTIAKTGTGQQMSQALQAGGDVNATDATGMTPIMYAAQYNKDPSVLIMLMQKGAVIDAKVIAAAKKNPNQAMVMLCQNLANMQAAQLKQQQQRQQQEAMEKAARSVKLNLPAWLEGEWTTKDTGDRRAIQIVVVSRNRVHRDPGGGRGSIEYLTDFFFDPANPPKLTETSSDTSYVLSGPTKTGTEKLTFTKIDAGHMTFAVQPGQGAGDSVTLISTRALEQAREKFDLQTPSWLQGNWATNASTAPSQQLHISEGDINISDEGAPSAFIDDTTATLQVSSTDAGYTVSGTIHGKPATWTFAQVDDKTISFKKSEDGKVSSGQYTRYVYEDYGK